MKYALGSIVVLPLIFACQTKGGLSHDQARALVAKEFVKTYKPEALRELEILNVEPDKESAAAKVSYRVVIDDTRDVNHPAQNRMRATAVFARQNGEWALRSVYSMDQQLEFLTE